MAKRSTAELERDIAASVALAKPAVIARRKTFDDKAVSLWSDGSLTWGMGFVIKGSPSARTPAQVDQALTAGWLVLGEIEVHDADEVPALIVAARKVARRGGLPGDVRKELAREAPLRPIWTVIEADRAGRPLVRVWRLPRISHPGLAVWDEVRGSHGRGRYQVMQELRERGRGTDAYASTGMQFHDLGKLAAYLRETSQLRSGR